MIPTGNKAKRLSSDNHTTKTIHQQHIFGILTGEVSGIQTFATMHYIHNINPT